MKASINRRHFIARLAALPVMAVGLPAIAAAAFRPVKRTGGPLLKPALNAYSFSDLLNAHLKEPAKGIDLFALCDFCSQQDFAGIDVTGYFFPGYPQVPKDEFIFALKRHAHALGLAISGTGVRNDFTVADPAARQRDVQLVKNWIEVAAKLGAPTLRVFADSQPPFKTWQAASGNSTRSQVEAWVAEALRECARHAEKFGIILTVQNHGDFIRTGEEHLSLLRSVDHEWCLAMVDTGQYHSADPYADMAMMAPYAANWQIKEHLFNRADGPRTDFKRLVKIIREAGYRGYLPIETLPLGRKDYDPFMEVGRVLQELRSAIQATESK